METKKILSIKQQTVIWSVGLTIQFFAQWVISVLLVRISGYQAAGVFALAMTVSNIFAYFANYGIRGFQVSSGIKEYSDIQYLTSRIITVFLSMIVCFLYLSFAINYTNVEKNAILLYLAYNAVNTISDTMQGTIQVRGHLEIGGYSNALRGFFCLVFFMTGLLISMDLIISLLLMLMGTLLITIAYDLPRYRIYIDKKKNRIADNLKAAIKILEICFPLMLSQTIPILTTAIPRRTIQKIFGANMLGIYSSIFAPTIIILTLIPAVVTALMPRMTEDWKASSLKSFSSWIWIGIVSIPTLCLVCDIGVVLFGSLILRFLFGEGILSYFSLLYWAVAVSIFSGAVAYYNGLMTVMRKFKVIAVLTFIALIFTFVFAYPFAQAWGLYGAACLQLIVYVMQVVLQIILILWFVRKRRIA